MATRPPPAAPRRVRFPLLVATAALAAVALGACREESVPEGPRLPSAQVNPPHPREQEREFVSEVFRVDRIFRSMLGPVFSRPAALIEGEPAELVWLTGFSVDIVGEDGQSPGSIEYECHSNLAWPPGKKPEGLHRPTVRAFTLTQGQTDVRLPPGTGLPALSDEKLNVFSQVLNLSQPNGSRSVRHRLRVRYVRDRDLGEPIKPLVMTHAFVMVSLEGKDVVYNVEHPSQEIEGASCNAGLLPPGIGGVYQDSKGRKFAGHWVVTPGRHEWRTLVTDQMKIPYDTTIHFIGVHVHPFSRSLELRDLTAGKSVWKSYQRDSEGRTGLDWVDFYSSPEGIPVYANHHYELVSSYDNPTETASDAMATMFIYYHDKRFVSPLAEPAHQTASPTRATEG